MKKFIVRDIHTLKIVAKFETRKEATEYCKQIYKRKGEGEILNACYVSIK